MDQVLEWIARVQTWQGRFSPQLLSGDNNTDSAVFGLQRFAALLDVYHSVTVDGPVVYMTMNNCCDSLDTPEGFSRFRPLNCTARHKALRQLIYNLLLLCTAGWVHWDCRLENVVIDDSMRLATIDFDWLEESSTFMQLPTDPTVNQ